MVRTTIERFVERALRSYEQDRTAPFSPSRWGMAEHLLVIHRGSIIIHALKSDKLSNADLGARSPA